MKLCVAQTRSIKGDIQGNVNRHQEIIVETVPEEVDMILFPELSLSGYEPSLADKLATNGEDGRLHLFQKISDKNGITIGVGIPTLNGPRPAISMVIFQPNRPRQTYSKEHIHADEEPYFVRGRNTATVLNEHPNIALAICYEISVPQHALAAYESGAEIYLASVAKTVKGVEAAHRRLAEIAR